MSGKYTFRRKSRGRPSSPSADASTTNRSVVKLKRYDQVNVKQERMSSDEEEEEESNNSKSHYNNVRIKAEAQSDNDGDEKESSNKEDDDLPEPKTKHFRRIKPIHDSDSDDSNDVGGALKRRKIQPRLVKNISSSSEHDTSSEEESSSTSSGSSSPKGHIEFESSSDDVGTDKSYTSSDSEEEIDDDGSKKLCIVCRNLGNAKIKGRSRLKSTSWCKCGRCKLLGPMKDYDLVCCREIKDVVDFLDDEMDDASKNNLCVTSHPRFETDVIKCRAIWRTGGYSRTNNYGNDDAYMGSWAFIRMIWNKLGWGSRMVVPACVSYRIKKENGTSCIKNFTAITTCETGRHCVESQH